MEIALRGEEKQIRGRKTHVDIDDILNQVLTHAASDWISSATPSLPTATCNLTYEVHGEQLNLSIGVQTVHGFDFDKLLPQNVFGKLQQQGVGMSSKYEGGRKIYEFKIPFAK